MKLDCFFLVAAFAAVTPVSAQVVRYDVGRRMIAFEREWGAVTDAAARKATLEPLNRGIRAFFGGKLAEAGRAMDDARFVLRGQATDAERWAASIVVRPERRLTGAGPLKLQVEQLYDPGVTAPAERTFKLQWANDAGEPIGDPRTESLDQLPKSVIIDVPTGPDSDLSLNVNVVTFGASCQSQIRISRAENLQSRLDKLKPGGGANIPVTVETMTRQSLAKLLASLADGSAPETQYPASRLLSEAEALADGNPYYTAAKPGEFWLRVPTGNTSTAVRLFVPDKLTADKSVPLVVALHGAGGSENLFFDGYGHGEVVRQCRARGWLLVATRAENFLGPPNAPALVDELAKRYPVDGRRVYLVGHSMGAGHAIALSQAYADRWAGVAALGGGGRVAKSDAVKRVPWFVGCGDQDFAFGGAKSLVKSLLAAGANVTFQIYPDIEHIVIVQAALPDVFKWFQNH